MARSYVQLRLSRFAYLAADRTLSDLAGIAPSTVDKGVEGDSLASILHEPSLPGKLYAFSQTQRVSIATLKRTGSPARPKDNPFKQLPAAADGFFDPSCWSYNSDIEWMGYSVRSAQFRFTRWHAWNGTGLCPIPSNNETLIELYDHRDDVSLFNLDVAEYANVAVGNVEVVAKLNKVLDSKVRLCTAQ